MRTDIDRAGVKKKSFDYSSRLLQLSSFPAFRLAACLLSALISLGMGGLATRPKLKEDYNDSFEVN
jgi:hypothetical protein